MSTSSIITLTLLLLTALYAIIVYNKLVSLRNRFKNAFAQIDVQLQRRYDLIPNLVESAKSYMSHEKETLTAVIKARNHAQNIENQVSTNPNNSQLMKQLGHAESLLDTALGKFFALTENYPEIKADQTIADMMEELTSTENKISYARQAFNDSVMHYNIMREQFPNAFIAGPCQFQEGELLELDNPKARENIKVNFN